MKLAELSFVDLAAIELMPALVQMSRFFDNDPEAAMARVAYAHAEALSAERDKRNGIRTHEIETLTARAVKAETALAMLYALQGKPEHALAAGVNRLLGALKAPDVAGALLEIACLRKEAGR